VTLATFEILPRNYGNNLSETAKRALLRAVPSGYVSRDQLAAASTKVGGVSLAAALVARSHALYVGISSLILAIDKARRGKSHEAFRWVVQKPSKEGAKQGKPGTQPVYTKNGNRATIVKQLGVLLEGSGMKKKRGAKRGPAVTFTLKEIQEDVGMEGYIVATAHLSTVSKRIEDKIQVAFSYSPTARI